MSRPLDLPDPVYDALTSAAAASGTTPVGWIVAHLPSAPAQGDDVGTPPAAKTMADLFRGRTGRISSEGSTVYSENCGELFTDGLEEKRREGRL